MNSRLPFRRGALAVAMSLGLSLSAAASADEFRFESHLLPDALMIEPLDRAALDSSVDLILKGPDNYISRTRFRAGQPVEFGLRGLADGVYRYELQLTRTPGPAAQRDGVTKIEGATITGASGVFTIVDGNAADRGLTESFGVSPTPKPGDSSIKSTAIVNDNDVGATRAQVINNDLIVIGSECVGQDCSNGESFGFDTIRLKENNLRIHFDDTSNSASFPRNDWRLVANETSNGGANQFSIEDATAGRSPMTIEAGAPSHSMFIDDGGRMGLGTSTPVVEMHMVNGDSPTVRLDQNGSSGFTPQVWDMAGNETNFFIRDVTNGSRLPFKIRPSSPTDALVLEQGGTRLNNLTTFSANVGMGTTTADHQLQVQGDSTVAPIKIQEASTTNAVREMLLIENNGGATIQFDDTSGDLHDWQLTARSFGFFITEEDSGTTEFVLSRGTGNLTIAGTLTQNSDVNRKTNITPVDPAEVLERVAELPISTWAYKEEDQIKHLGPMAQDFYKQFGLGDSERRIATIDTSGVALAAIQGLKQELDRKDDQIRALRAEIERLNEAASAQAELVSRIEDLTARLTTVEQVQDATTLADSIE
ncbi:MAG: tail fiber domain-containing protein, partial [Wenzhouxiangellaceae bacterium]